MNYLLIDCGTTNLRVTLLSEDFAPLDVVRADGGVRHTAIDGHNGRLKESLAACIRELLVRNGLTHDGIGRCIACGMITSNVGLCEIPHVPAPASAKELREHMRVEVFPEIAPFPIGFIPGVRNFAGAVDMDNFAQMDMMRGEETEAIGLFRLLSLRESAVLILPGSHNKFVAMDAQGRILGCMTSISGELLDSLTHHTLLADAVGRAFASSDDYDGAMARAGARECLRSGLGRAAFAGRILSQLGGKSPVALRSYLLGAALALDAQALSVFADADARLFVAGKSPLQPAMIDVLDELGRRAEAVPGELSAKMGIAGAVEIAFGS